MRKRLMLGLLIVCMILAANTPVLANKTSKANLWSRGEITQLLSSLQGALDGSGRPLLTPFLENARDHATSVLSQSQIDEETGLSTKKALTYAVRLAQDLNRNTSLWTNTPFAIYEVAALSSEKKLPDSIPAEGVLSNKVSVISAQNEYEAASFVLAPLADVEEVEFTVSDLQSGEHVISAGAIDLHVVKNWYQGGTAWYSYFFDPYKLVLTPELLLHDEKLIKVDHEQKKNFIRVDYPEGSVYKDTTAAKFNRFSEPVEDSPVLLPIELKQGESKQMWITTKVDAGTPAGIYKGTIAITADGAAAGQLELQIQVLPFELPKPKTYYDVEKDFVTMLYTHGRVKELMASTNNNTALVHEKLRNEYSNMVEHGISNISSNFYEANNPQQFFDQYDLMAEAGFNMDFMLGIKQTYPSYSPYFVAYSNYLKAKTAYEADPTPQKQAIMNGYYTTYRQGVDAHKQVLRDTFNAVSAHVGHTNFYFDAWDEAGADMLQFQQEIWKFIQEDLGAKVYATGNESHLNLEVKENFLNWAGEASREKADAWHALGEDRMITNYAYPHTAPENPDFMRQRHGMSLYKANYDATFNYIYYENADNVWNDDVQGTFRNLTFVYPTKTDVIDTIAWEGFREGVDDIRYATKLKQLAAEAIASGDAARVAAATKAEAWLEETDERSTDSDLLRLEMIYHIMRMIELAE